MREAACKDEGGRNEVLFKMGDEEAFFEVESGKGEGCAHEAAPLERGLASRQAHCDGTP